MTALRFQTGGRHYTSPASLWGRGRERGEGGESEGWTEKMDGRRERGSKMRQGRKRGRDETRKKRRVGGGERDKIERGGETRQRERER